MSEARTVQESIKTLIDMVAALSLKFDEFKTEHGDIYQVVEDISAKFDIFNGLKAPATSKAIASVSSTSGGKSGKYANRQTYFKALYREDANTFSSLVSPTERDALFALKENKAELEKKKGDDLAKAEMNIVYLAIRNSPDKWKAINEMMIAHNDS